MKRHSDYHVTIPALTQFDGRARGDDVTGNLTVSLLRASQVTVGMLAYRCLRRFIKPAPDELDEQPFVLFCTGFNIVR